MDLQALVVGGVVDSVQVLLATLRAQAGLILSRCRLVSIRSVEETDRLIAALIDAFGVEVRCVQPAKELAGMNNGYKDHEQLGLGRWLALLGGFHLAGGDVL